MNPAALAGVPTPALARPRHLLLAALALVAALLAMQVEGMIPRLLPREAPTGGPGVLEAGGAGYRARFDGDGFSFRPAGATAPLRVDLSAVSVGGRSMELDLGRWTAAGDVVERPVGRALTERVTARDGEVEWDVVLDRALPGSGDLVVRGDLSGTAGAASVKDGLVVVPLPGDASALVGEVVVRDAGGAVLHRALPVVTGDAIELRVPASALDGARYPVTVDPTVSPARTPAPARTNAEPAIAYSGGTDATHLIVWQEFVTTVGQVGQWDIYGAIVTEDGIGGTSPKKLSTGTAGDFRPDVAWNGTNYLVVFESQYVPNPSDVDITAQLVDKNGNLVGGNFGIVTTSHGQGQPAITATSTGFTIAWNDNRNGNWDIYAGRYSATGSPQDGTGVRMSVDGPTLFWDEFYPDVSWNGTSTMVVWEEKLVSEWDIRSARLFANGTPDTTYFGAVRGGYHLQRASVASDGDGWLVAFEETNVSTGAKDIAGIRLSSTNFHTGIFPISRQAGNETDPSVAYGAGNFLVTLTDRRHPGDPDVRAIRVNRQGALVDPDTFFVEGETNENDFAAVSPGRAGGWGVGYEYGTGPQTAIRWRHVSK